MKMMLWDDLTFISPFSNPLKETHKHKSSPFSLKPEKSLLESLIVCLFWKYKPKEWKETKVNHIQLQST